MKGYQVSRSLSQHSSGPCHCVPDDCDVARDYPDHYQGHNDHPYYPPGGPPEPLATAPSGGGTFPRSHPPVQQQTYDSCEECLSSHGPAHGHGSAHGHAKMHRIPPNLLDQFEKQLPFQPDGFHTLQYQRAASVEQRSESPSRIRHLVNSVQRLFAKSHSLEAPAKRELNGTHGGGRERDRGHRGGGEDAGGHHHAGTHQSRSARRNKSRERSKSGDSRHEARHGSRHRSRTAGWWSSDDNLDSDSSFLVPGGRGGRGLPTGHESLDAAIQELTLKKTKGPGPGECLACSTMARAGDGGHSLKRSTWSAMTVSQAREAYPTSRGGGAGGGGPGYDKALVPLDTKIKERSLHYLKVPSDDWGGGAVSDSGGEIPCRRMRSGSYIKAMGDDDSGDSEPSPKTSPKRSLLAQREAFRRSVSMDQRSSIAKYSCKQCTDSYSNSRPTLKGHPRSRSYTRSLTSSQLGETLKRQFDDPVFGELESQAVEALDLPGCFRTRSHSYVRAIQAGCSQDDDCLSVFSMAGPQGSAKGGAVFPYRKGPPPLPPRMSKPMISVTAQSSTESTQDAYFQSTGQPGLGRPRQQSNSVDLTESSVGRTSRGGHYPGTGPARFRQASNSAESMDGRALRDAIYPSGLGPVRPKHSTSADSLLEGPRVPRERGAGSLGKSASLPQNSVALSKAAQSSEEHRQEAKGRKWRSSIAVQVDSSETLSDSDTEGRALREVHSIGVQVEDDKRRARFKRSNSVTASVQADLEMEGFGTLSVPTQDKGLQFGCSFQRHSSEPESAGQLVEYRTVHTQGQWAYRDDYHTGYSADPCPLELRAPTRARSPLTPERAAVGWHEGPRSLPDSGRVSPCLRDGEFFLRLLQTEVERVEGWCQNMEREAEENELPEEVLELIRAAVGSAQILMSQKVQQFFRMCQQSVDPSAYPQPSSQDLASFWDLLQLAIEDVRVKFQDLQQIKDSGWRLPPEKKDEKKLPPPLPKKPAGGVSGTLRAESLSETGLGGAGMLMVSRGRGVPVREKSLDLGERPRQEACRRLLQAGPKRTASFRQNSATESADSIEIYIPEAQTRL
ncbi:disks large-associated protein 3 [Brachyhypopomus gauderio]|uniref:disks large-associated protein 3 n=1 Tax=Brachyhypopomus gauderio TaxID=698409 RepID=UPI00404204C1